MEKEKIHYFTLYSDHGICMAGLKTYIFMYSKAQMDTEGRFCCPPPPPPWNFKKYFKKVMKQSKIQRKEQKKERKTIFVYVCIHIYNVNR